MSNYDERVEEIQERMKEIDQEKSRLKMELISLENQLYDEKMSLIEINPFNLMLFAKKNWMRSNRRNEVEEYLKELRSIVLNWDSKGKANFSYNPWNTASTLVHEKEISEFLEVVKSEKIPFVASCFGDVQSLEGKLVPVLSKQHSKNQDSLFLLISSSGRGSLLKKRVSSQVHYEELTRMDQWQLVIPYIIFKFGRESE